VTLDNSGEPYPSYQGGRASQQWGVTTRIAPYSLMAPAPPAPTSTEVAQAESVAVGELAAEVVPDTTHIAAEGGLSLLGWVVRWWLRMTIQR
jgi:hypothetical protein